MRVIWQAVIISHPFENFGVIDLMVFSVFRCCYVTISGYRTSGCHYFSPPTASDIRNMNRKIIVQCWQEEGCELAEDLTAEEFMDAWNRVFHFLQTDIHCLAEK